MSVSSVVRPPVSRCGAFHPLRSTQSRTGLGSSVRFPRVPPSSQLIVRVEKNYYDKDYYDKDYYDILRIPPNSSQLAVIQAYYRLLREKQIGVERDIRARKNYYEILGISPSASELEVVQAFYRLCLQHANAYSGKKLELAEAYNVLRTKDAREEYNLVMGIGRDIPLPRALFLGVFYLACYLLLARPTMGEFVCALFVMSIYILFSAVFY